MKLNNKGVSLVELIVTIAILGIISVGVQGFTLVSAKINSNVNSNVKLQYESQMVMANVQKHIVNAGDKVSWYFDTETEVDAKTKTLLMLTAGEGEAADSVKVLFFNKEQKILYYGEGPVAESGPTTVSIYKLSENITDFSVSFTPDAGKATKADITLEAERNREKYVGVQSVALRNKPEQDDSFKVIIGYTT